MRLCLFPNIRLRVSQTCVASFVNIFLSNINNYFNHFKSRFPILDLASLFRRRGLTILSPYEHELATAKETTFWQFCPSHSTFLIWFCSLFASLFGDKMLQPRNSWTGQPCTTHLTCHFYRDFDWYCKKVKGTWCISLLRWAGLGKRIRGWFTYFCVRIQGWAIKIVSTQYSVF